jgi:ankyrin repeat protein
MLAAVPAFQTLAEADAQLNRNLHDAAENGRTDEVKRLLDQGADVNGKGMLGGYTALMLAAVKGHAEVVKLLIDKGADVNAKDTIFGITALMVAVNNMQIVKLLIDKGADVHAKNMSGKTALMLAEMKGKTAVADLLRSKGAK